MRNLAGLILVESINSLKATEIVEFKATLVNPLAGVELVTVGGRSTRVTLAVLSGETLPAASLAQA